MAPKPQGIVEFPVFQNGRWRNGAIIGEGEVDLRQTFQKAHRSGYRPLNCPQALEAIAADPALASDFPATATIVAKLTIKGSPAYVVAHEHPYSKNPNLLGGILPNFYMRDPRDISEIIESAEDGKPFSEAKAVYVLSEQEFARETIGVDWNYSLQNAQRSWLLTAFAGGDEKRGKWLEAHSRLYRNRPIELDVLFLFQKLKDDFGCFLKINDSGGFNAADLNSPKLVICVRRSED